MTLKLHNHQTVLNLHQLHDLYGIPKMSLLKLPTELHLDIIERLDWESLLCLNITNTYLRSIITTDHLDCARRCTGTDTVAAWREKGIRPCDYCGGAHSEQHFRREEISGHVHRMSHLQRLWKNLPCRGEMRYSDMWYASRERKSSLMYGYMIRKRDL
jgi:Zn ribbon nucleic-acid-binding protein